MTETEALRKVIREEIQRLDERESYWLRNYDNPAEALRAFAEEHLGEQNVRPFTDDVDQYGMEGAMDFIDTAAEWDDYVFNNRDDIEYEMKPVVKAYLEAYGPPQFG